MSLDLSLYLVTDPVLCGERGLVAVVREAVAGGVNIVQLRDKTSTDADITTQLAELADAIDGRALLLVNDRLDVALEARRLGIRVDGVHLGQGDVNVSCARELLGPDAIIGLTANTTAHVEAVAALPAGTVDYLGVGVIRPTATKPDHPPALGVDGFRAIASATRVPCVAIGGIGLSDVDELRAAGAAGVAVVSALCATDDPRATARKFTHRWRGNTVPRILSIAGSDPSGGAGIQADLKSIAANGGYGMAALTALTAQNTRGVRDVHVPPAEFLRAQLDAVADDIDVDAVKIGMLANAEVIRTIVDWLQRVRPPIVVIDPVMVSTSGDRLLDADAESALRELLVHADLITPNLVELAALTGSAAVDSWPDAVERGKQLASLVGAAVLVKGGHLPGDDTPDVLVTTSGEIHEFTGRRIHTRATHGTGCSLSAALATRRARGEAWPTAVASARAWLRESLCAGEELAVGEGHGPINHFAGMWRRGGWDTRPTATEVEAEWWERIADTRSEIDDLPFIRTLADGSLPRESFLFYLAQDALYLHDYARLLADAARLAPTSAEQAFWAHSAHNAIAVELELHSSWLEPAHARKIREGTATTAYLEHLRACAYRGDYAELIAALLPCYWLYTDLGLRLHSGEFGVYARDPEHPYASWLLTYADSTFAETTRQAIGYVADAASKVSDEYRARMFSAFERSAQFEREFFAAPLEESAMDVTGDHVDLQMPQHQR